MRLRAKLELRSTREEGTDPELGQHRLEGDEGGELGVERRNDGREASDPVVDVADALRQRFDALLRIGDHEDVVHEVLGVDAWLECVVGQSDRANGQVRRGAERSDDRDSGARVVGGVEAGDCDGSRLHGRPHSEPSWGSTPL